MKVTDTSFPVATLADQVVEEYISFLKEHPDVRVLLIQHKQQLIDYLVAQADAVCNKCSKWEDRLLTEGEPFLQQALMHWFYVRFTDSFPQVVVPNNLQGQQSN